MTAVLLRPRKLRSFFLDLLTLSLLDRVVPKAPYPQQLLVLPPSPSHQPKPANATDSGWIIWLLGVVLLALWGQLYAGASGIWRDGEYYTYGWYVPLLALWLAWRRWPDAFLPTDAPCRLHIGHVALFAALVLWLPAARALALADGDWRPPLLLQAILVAGATLSILALWRGRRVAWHFAPVVIFALSAMPFPYQWEKIIISELTGKVVALTREAFLWGGHAVEVRGEQLMLDGVAVEVSDGCSGVRSLQTLLMAALFFGEFFRLHILGRLLLLGCAAVAALVVNSGRAIYLGQVTFSRGPDAGDAAHDPAGMFAFLIAAAGLLAAAKICLNIEHRRNRRIVRRLVASKTS